MEQKNIYMDNKNGILHYYGNPAGYVDGDKVVVDFIFYKQDVLTYIEKEIGKQVEAREGVFNRLVKIGFRQGEVSPAGHLSIKIYQLIPDGHLLQQFTSLRERRDKGLGEPRREEYKLTYEGEVDKYDLEDIWDRFSRFVRGEEGAHALSISDIVELTDGVNSRFFYIDPYGFAEISF